MKHKFKVLLAVLMVPGAMTSAIATAAQSSAATTAPSMRLERGITIGISEHVHVIPSKGRAGVPNVGIVVGQRATLIVDTGLGTANGQVVLEEMRKISKNERVYLTATHFHPEHIGGENAFPAQAHVLRARAQQAEVDAAGARIIDMFRRISADNRTLLQGFEFRPADIVFDRELVIDLGGVSVQLLALGPAHTNGDTMILVPEDRVLFTGDIVQKRLTPVLTGEKSTAQSWLQRLNDADKTNASTIVPSHGDLTDSSAIGENRAVLEFLQRRASELQQSGNTADAAAEILIGEYRERFPQWLNPSAVRISMPRLFEAAK